MQSIISLCAIAAVVSAVKQENYRLPAEFQNKLKQNALPCAEEFNVDPINLRKIGDGTLPRDDASNKFLHCFAINSGFIDQTGRIFVDGLTRVVKDHPRREEFKEVMKTCTEDIREDPVATTVAAHKCYSENSPILFEYDK